MAVKIGRREVVTAGSVIVEEPNSVEIQVGELSVTIEFADRDDPKQSVDLKQTGERSLLISLVNFSNSLGTAFDHKIGDINERPLIMALLIHALGENRKIRLLNYTFSIGEGWAS